MRQKCKNADCKQLHTYTLYNKIIRLSGEYRRRLSRQLPSPPSATDWRRHSWYSWCVTTVLYYSDTIASLSLHAVINTDFGISFFLNADRPTSISLMRSSHHVGICTLATPNAKSWMHYLKMASSTAYSPNSTRLATSRIDTTRHVRLVEPMHFGCVEPVQQHGSTRSTRSSRLARHAHLDVRTRYVERVVSCRQGRDELSGIWAYHVAIKTTLVLQIQSTHIRPTAVSWWENLSPPGARQTVPSE